MIIAGSRTMDAHRLSGIWAAPQGLTQCIKQTQCMKQRDV